MAEVVLVRHGQTEWSRDGRHTGRTDVPLTAQGEADATALRPRLDRPFGLVLTSPLQRAARTASLAGLSASVEEDLVEWDYGPEEGRTTAQARETRPGWSVWDDDGAGSGETLAAAGRPPASGCSSGCGRCWRPATTSASSATATRCGSSRPAGSVSRRAPVSSSCCRPARCRRSGYEHGCPAVLGWNT